MVSLLTRDLACRQAVELVTDYLEGKLSRRQQHRFERHLRGCPHCTTYLEQIRSTIALAGEIGPEPLDSDTREGLIELYRRFHAGD